MAEMIGKGVLAGVCLLLLIGLLRQFATSSRRWLMLDGLAVIPQWKFFGQRDIGQRPDIFDDLHLLARSSPTPDAPGDWREIEWSTDRKLLEAIWNPGSQRKSAIFEAMAALAVSESLGERAARPTALSYLTVLRRCLDVLDLPQGSAIQFAIIATRGRDNRPVSLKFLSSWHHA